MYIHKIGAGPLKSSRTREARITASALDEPDDDCDDQRGTDGEQYDSVQNRIGDRACRSCSHRDSSAKSISITANAITAIGIHSDSAGTTTLKNIWLSSIRKAQQPGKNAILGVRSSLSIYQCWG